MTPTSKAVLFKNCLYWIAYVLIGAASGFVATQLPAPWSRLGSGVLTCAGIFLVSFWFLKWDKMSLKDGGLVVEAGTIPRFLKGVGLGVLAVLLTVGVLLGIGKAQLTPNPPVDWSLLGPLLVAIVFHALHEEIAFRSYSIRTLQPSWGLWVSQFIIAVAFGAYHVVNGWGIANAVTGPCVWSLVYGLSAVLSRGIALPTGIHTAMNVCYALLGSEGLRLLEPLNATPRQFHYLGEGIRILIVVVWVVVLVSQLSRKKKSPSAAVPVMH